MSTDKVPGDRNTPCMNREAGCLAQIATSGALSIDAVFGRGALKPRLPTLPHPG